MKIVRKYIIVQGIVQGVGFRPFIYNLAASYPITGFVTNTSQGVLIEAEGKINEISNFIEEIKLQAPPLSVITDISVKDMRPINSTNFTIKKSSKTNSVTALISPDIAVCDDCLKELFDPNDRRYLYPFINCTNCGPRYTIIEKIPYDRPYTSMKHFKMCSDCQAEYDDPRDRRFHAQPNACAKCGPQVQLFDSNRELISADNAIESTIEYLKNGKIIAIKGLGGFHLAVDATNNEAVHKLRQLKGRDEKPLALMVSDSKTVEKYCLISAEEEQILKSPTAPILLLKKLEDIDISESVAPGNDHLGIMLPYTPLHQVLFLNLEIPLVMTSANFSEEPICINNDEAFERLKNIADYYLIHNRDIYLRSDDSVAIHLANKLRYFRRSRGVAPKPLFVKSQGLPVLAVGGELKNTICFLKDDKAILSQHIGDLENIEANNFFKLSIDHLQNIFNIEPKLIVHDLHPQYLSTQWAMEQSTIPLLGVQHHHAHLAACMAENKLQDPVIGIIMDGTGYGTDNTIWGGEILIGDYTKFDRFALLELLPLPGGDAAIKAPWRTAVSYLYKTFGDLIPDLKMLEKHDAKSITEMIDKNINSPLTSSCGRLFDAVAAIAGGRQTIKYEAQAAIELMQAFESIDVRPFSFVIENKNNNRIVLIQPIIRSLIRSVQNNESFSKISSRFHATLIQIYLEIANEARTETGINNVVLSGGVFQNMILFKYTISILKKANFNVFTHSQVPTNDGGVSLGQAMIGRHKVSL